MATEIERKFWVKSTAFMLLRPLQSYSIIQGYLNRDKDRTVRVRIAGGSEAYITVKGPTTGCSRKEYEYEIPVEDATEMLTLCIGTIDKTRYVVHIDDGLKIEVDVFHGLNEGLVIAEIELRTEDEKYKAPDWLGDEISPYSEMYHMLSNSRLSLYPYSTWNKA